MKLTAYIVDDEPLAIERLVRLLDASGRVTVLGSDTNPHSARAFLEANTVDILFLDICMPQMSGFDLLGKLSSQPKVIFTTAFDQYALKAFEVNSIDYLLKPIEPKHLDRALKKIEQLQGGHASAVEVRKLIEQMAGQLGTRRAEYPKRIASRLGDRICFIDLPRVTHFHAEDKLTYAVADGKSYAVDHTISDLESRLDPNQFIRIHRATLVNAAWVKEIAPSFAGALIVKLKDDKHTELSVARSRAHETKTRLGL